MKRHLALLAVLATLPLLLCMGKSPGLTLTWLSEGEEIDGPKMVRKDVEPAPDGKLHFFRITPMVTQRSIRAMKPMLGEDGTWGAAFLLDEDGWRSIQATSAMDSGRLLRVMVSGRPVEFQRIMRPTNDDHIICIWRGITDAEMEQLKKKYKPLSKPAKSEGS